MAIYKNAKRTGKIQIVFNQTTYTKPTSDAGALIIKTIIKDTYTKTSSVGDNLIIGRVDSNAFGNTVTADGAQIGWEFTSGTLTPTRTAAQFRDYVLERLNDLLSASSDITAQRGTWSAINVIDNEGNSHPTLSWNQTPDTHIEVNDVGNSFAVINTTNNSVTAEVAVPAAITDEDRIVFKFTDGEKLTIVKSTTNYTTALSGTDNDTVTVTFDVNLDTIGLGNLEVNNQLQFQTSTTSSSSESLTNDGAYIVTTGSLAVKVNSLNRVAIASNGYTTYGYIKYSDWLGNVINGELEVTKINNIVINLVDTASFNFGSQQGFNIATFPEGSSITNYSR